MKLCVGGATSIYFMHKTTFHRPGFPIQARRSLQSHFYKKWAPSTIAQGRQMAMASEEW